MTELNKTMTTQKQNMNGKYEKKIFIHSIGMYGNWVFSKRVRCKLVVQIYEFFYQYIALQSRLHPLCVYINYARNSQWKNIHHFMFKPCQRLKLFPWALGIKASFYTCQCTTLYAYSVFVEKIKVEFEIGKLVHRWLLVRFGKNRFF